jgi:hypothetical protein
MPYNPFYNRNPFLFRQEPPEVYPSPENPLDEAFRRGKNAATQPGGNARGGQVSAAADKWRIPAAELAEKIWRESPGLSTVTVRDRILKSLPEDKRPPSERTLADHIRPLKPPKE